MSNLWFFRLKRAEQQRRRSSGEQSVGSCASNHSGASNSATSLVQLAPSRSGSNASEQNSTENADDQNDQLDSYNYNPLAQVASAAGQQSGPVSRQEMEAIHHEAEHEVNYQQQRQRYNQLPQVTIIRSDSNSSNIPIAECGQLADSSAGQTGEICAKRPLVCNLNQSNGSIESSCPISAAQLEFKVRQVERFEANTTSGLHDQLISGKVPPIRERRLLNPTGAGLTLADSMDNLAALIPRVRVEFYNSENTLKEQLQMYFIKDHTVSLYLRTAKLILKVLACYLYVFRVILDRGPAQAVCYGREIYPANANNTYLASSTTGTNLTQLPCSPGAQQSSLSKFDSHPYEGPINFCALFWVDRGPVVWTLQTIIAVICFLEAILMQYLTWTSIFSIVSFHFTLELVTNSPFIISIFWQELRTLFVPGFLNCWLAKQCLEAMLNDLSIVRQSSVFSHRLTILSATVFCLIFTSACGFQHTERTGPNNINIFESIYFVVVTFSTVGYGDFKPETWPSQAFIMVMICVALIVLPTQFEQLAYFWIERKKLGASYAHHSSRNEKHVVVCSTTLRADTIMDFLNEFYAHPLLQTFSVVLLSPCELDTTMKLVLQTPTWNNRVVYIQGSALKATDLIRARMQSAEACFILAARNYNDRSAADEHTILRSWAIRDFSPYVPQYVQIFRTENKIHVAFAEHVVCDDEFKYALLANNCLIPGTSTLVTLLLHTSQQQDRQRRRRRRRRRRKGHQQQPERGLLSAFFNWGGSSGGAAAPGKRGQEYSQFSEANLEQTGATLVGRRKEHDNLLAGDREGGARRAKDDEDDEEDDDDEDDDDGADANGMGGAGGPEWKRLYGKCSANEIYHIRLSDSRFFGEYQGKSFTYASFHSHRKFGVALIGVQTDMRGTWPIMLNPGPSYVLKSGDILFYINITKEENSTLMPMLHQEKRQLARAAPSSAEPDSGEYLAPPSGYRSTNPVGEQCSEPPEAAAERPLGQTELAGNSEHPSLSQQQQQPLPLPVSLQAATTYIRIESSSPTVGQQQQQPEAGCLLQAASRGRLDTPKKHSVADGAGIVARSMCSMAGIVSNELAHLEANTFLDRRDSDGFQTGPKRGSFGAGCKPRGELQSLAANLLAKRNSSASTSAAALINQHQQGVASSRMGSRNTSTLELASIAKGLRKGSNMSITSSKSRDISPTRLKQVVSGLAVKMKRVKLGKSLTHLTIPRMDYGGSSASSTESFVQARGRRPSIAPVPAMMGESEEHDSDHEREQESYFAMSWQSSSESSPIVKKFVFCTTYVGVSPTLCYMLQRKKAACCLQLISTCEHCPFKNARQYNWPNRCIILASDFASNGIYNFLVPLRAHFHNPNELRPIVLLLERKPSPQFIDAISWFPMVYWMPGSIDSLDDLIKAGINLAHSVVVTNKESTNSAEEDYLADCNTIVAVQTMFKMFPSVGIITELSQSSNMRFMQFRAHDVLFGGFSMANYYQSPAAEHFCRADSKAMLGGEPVDSRSSAGATGGATAAAAAGSPLNQGRPGETVSSSAAAQGNAIRDRIRLRKLHSQHYNKSMGKDVNSHAYKYRLPFAAGNVFSASMLDTLLYQAFVKDYMITMVRLLLGVDQAPGSGFLSSMKITKEELWIRTYGRLYQRLCSTTCEIPLGIYRTEPLETQRHESFSFGAFASQQASYEHATEELERIEITNMVKNRLQDLGMLVSDYDDSPANRNNTFSYVIINPNCDIHLREGDIIYLIRPSPIHSRKLFMHRANSVRHTDEHSAANVQANTSSNNHLPNQTNLFTCPPAELHKSGQTPGQRCSAELTANQTQQKPVSHSAMSALIRSAEGQAAADDQEQELGGNKFAPAAANNDNVDDESPHQSQQQQPQSQVYLKSCLSDGDFSKIRIKVNDDQVNERGELDSLRSAGFVADQANESTFSPTSCANSNNEPPHCCNLDRRQENNSRRRSSCSDAEDSRKA